MKNNIAKSQRRKIKRLANTSNNQATLG